MHVGHTGWAVLLAVLVATLAVMWRAQRSLKSNPPIESHRGKKAQAIGVYVVVMLAVFAIIIFSDYLPYRKLVAIQQHGGRADGTVDSIYVAGCGRSGPCTLGVRYHYSAPAPEHGGSIQLMGDELLGPDRSDDPYYVYASSKGHVPIAFDSEQPQESALNFDDSVFTGGQAFRRLAQMKSFAETLLIAAAIMSLVLIAALFGLRWANAART